MSEPTPINPEIRSGKNTTGAKLPKGAVVKLKAAPTVPDEVALVGASTDGFYGVVAEDIDPGDYGNIQIRGRAPVLCGAALTVGGYVTAGTGGKAKNATAGDRLLGMAVTAGAADALAEVELAGPGAGQIAPEPAGG